MTKSKLNLLIEKIINQTPNDLKYQKIIRELINNQFKGQTYRFNGKQLLIFIVGQYIPVMITVFMEKDGEHLFAVINTLCIWLQALTVGYFSDIETRQIDINRKAYMENGWNIVDNLYIGATCLQVAIRMV